MSKSYKVELRNAYEWTCPTCKLDYYEKGVLVEFADEDVESLVEKYGGGSGDWITGEWITRPDEVVCPKCGASYETEDVGMYEEEDVDLEVDLDEEE